MAKALGIMAPSCISLRLVLASLLLLFALHSDAFPATLGNQTSLAMFNTAFNVARPLCYTPDSEETPGIQPVDLNACKDALRVLIHTPEFARPHRFSRNPRTMAKKLPLGWQLGHEADCRIVVSCSNDRDSAVFRFADVAQVARRIIDHCVDRPDPDGRYPLLRWGGVEGILEGQSFYVAVARPIESGLEVEVANKTGSAGWGLDDGGFESS